MNIFEFDDYRDLINSSMAEKLGRGSKVKLAEELNCNPGYISQVLSKTKIHFTSENIIRISAFLKLEAHEEDFLMSLLHYERAGSQDLKRYWKDRLSLLRKQHLKVEKQVKNISQELSETAKAIYYSHWAYCTVHMLVSIDHFKSAEDISKRINISSHFATKVVSFLLENGLITNEKNGLAIGKTRIHLKSDSPLVKAHHQNFRNKAILSLENENDFDLHYSGVLTLSKKDGLKIRQLLLKFIADKEEILLPSANEDIIGLSLDLFKFGD